MNTSTSTSGTDPHSIDETAVEIPCGKDELVNVSSSEDKTKNSIISRKLSTISKQYDVNGDGVLDDAEMAMRELDKTGRGYLTNDKVYALMREQMETQKQLFRARRAAFALLALVVILALSNLGTSFAAASLAKDTTTSSNEELTDKRTREVLSTQTSVEYIEFERTVVAPNGRRRLCTADDEDVECSTNSFRTISASMCDAMISHCKRGNTVNLKRTWKNGDETSFNVCPYKSGTISGGTGKSRLTNGEGKEFLFETIAGGACRISGDAVAQEVDDICAVDGDCASSNCKKDADRIAACKDRCDMLRFAASRLPGCYASCDHATCHVSST
jgi:hypothetical protein